MGQSRSEEWTPGVFLDINKEEARAYKNLAQPHSVFFLLMHRWSDRKDNQKAVGFTRPFSRLKAPPLFCTPKVSKHRRILDQKEDLWNDRYGCH